jgi:hypothetical protein
MVLRKYVLICDTMGTNCLKIKNCTLYRDLLFELTTFLYWEPILRKPINSNDFTTHPKYQPQIKHAGRQDVSHEKTTTQFWLDHVKQPIVSSLLCHHYITNRGLMDLPAFQVTMTTVILWGV